MVYLTCQLIKGRTDVITSVEGEMMMGRGRELGTKLLDEISTANLVRGSSRIETAKSTKLPFTHVHPFSVNASASSNLYTRSFFAPFGTMD